MKSRRGEVNTLAVIVIAGAVGVGAWCVKDTSAVKNMLGKLGFGKSETKTEMISKDKPVDRSPHLKQAKEILRALEDNFGEFLRAGALEDLGCADSENESWRERNIFMLSGGRIGFIDAGKFADNFTKTLQADTLEINDDGTLFQADISDPSSFSASSLIDSLTVRADSLRPSNAQYMNLQDIFRRIADTIKNFSGTPESYGYIRFVFKTDDDSAKIMASFSLDPYAFSQHKSFLVLGKNYVFTNSSRHREIEEMINVMSDINAVSFTMKHGTVESYDNLTECLEKFVQSFAE